MTCDWSPDRDALLALAEDAVEVLLAAEAAGEHVAIDAEGYLTVVGCHADHADAVIEREYACGVIVRAEEVLHRAARAEGIDR